MCIRDRLLLLDADGRIRLSRDGGRTSQVRGSVEGQAVSFIAGGDALYVALADGSVMQSTDDGASFAVRARL